MDFQCIIVKDVNYLGISSGTGVLGGSNIKDNDKSIYPFFSTASLGWGRPNKFKQSSTVFFSEKKNPSHSLFPPVFYVPICVINLSSTGHRTPVQFKGWKVLHILSRLVFLTGVKLLCIPFSSKAWSLSSCLLFEELGRDSEFTGKGRRRVQDFMSQHLLWIFWEKGFLWAKETIQCSKKFYKKKILNLTQSYSLLL